MTRRASAPSRSSISLHSTSEDLSSYTLSRDAVMCLDTSCRSVLLRATDTAMLTYWSMSAATQHSPSTLPIPIFRYMPAASCTTVCSDGAVMTGVPAAKESSVLTPPPHGKGSSATSAAAIKATNCRQTKQTQPRECK